MQKPVLDETPAYIYALIDPRSRQIRYIGRTSNPRLRLRTHCTRGMTGGKVSAWIDHLKILGLTPLLRIIEQIPQRQASRVEYIWIMRYRTFGHLLNTVLTPGTKGAYLDGKNNFERLLDKLLS